MNLLPKTEKQNLNKGLKIRLSISAMFLVSAAFLVGFVMLLPAYFLVSGYFSNASDNSFLALEDDALVKNILNLPSEINTKLDLFQQITGDISVAEHFSRVVSYMPDGVELNSMSFAKDQLYNGKEGITFLISGIASNRDSLVSFASLLEQSGLFSAVEVPVSSLTRNRDLPFSMNLFIENSK